MNINLGAYDQYYLACAVVVGTYLAAATLLWLSQRSSHAPLIASFRGIAQNFLTVINVIFALNLAFLANDTWNAHDRALNAVFQEAGSLRTLKDLARDLPDPARTGLDAAVAAYAERVVNAEWPMLARRQSSPEAGEALDALFTRLGSGEVTRVTASSLHAAMLQQAVQVRSMRDQRITLSRTHVNPLKWMGMAFLGLLTMISIAMVHVDLPRAQLLSVLLFATAAAPTAAIILIHGNPFQEPMAVRPEPIARLLDSGLLNSGLLDAGRNAASAGQEQRQSAGAPLVAIGGCAASSSPNAPPTTTSSGMPVACAYSSRSFSSSASRSARPFCRRIATSLESA